MLNRAVSSSFASLRFDEQIGENGDIVKDKFRRQPALFQRFERRFSCQHKNAGNLGATRHFHIRIDTVANHHDLVYLGKLLEALQERNYEYLTVSELLNIKSRYYYVDE